MTLAMSDELYLVAHRISGVKTSVVEFLIEREWAALCFRAMKIIFLSSWSNISC